MCSSDLVLAEEAKPVGDLDRAAAEADLKALQGQLSGNLGEAERAALEGRLAVAEAKLTALGSA